MRVFPICELLAVHISEGGGQLFEATMTLLDPASQSIIII